MKMSCKKMVSSVIIGIMVLGLVASHANAITCTEAISTLMPCKDYLIGKSNFVSVPCCTGASALNGKVKTKPELKSMCECLKQAAAALHVIPERAKSLPGICKITTPVPIDPNADCNSI
ncbi:hypothetical protein ABFS83_13G127400 [Erythranthe nasuta]